MAPFIAVYSFLFLSVTARLVSADCTQASLDNCTVISPSLNDSGTANYTIFCIEAQLYESCLQQIVCNVSDDASVRQQLQSNLTDILATVNTTCSTNNSSTGFVSSSYCTQAALDNCTAIKPASLNGSNAANYTSFCSDAHLYESCLQQIVCNGSDDANVNQQLQSNLTDIIATVNTTCSTNNSSTVAVRWASAGCTQDDLNNCTAIKPQLLNDSFPANFTTYCSEARVYQSCLRQIVCNANDDFNVTQQLRLNLIDVNATMYTTCSPIGPLSTECSEANVKRCLTFLPASLTNKTASPWSAVAFDQICGDPLNAFGRCLNTISCNRTGGFVTIDNLLKTSMGLLNMYQYMCLNDTRSVFARNFNCLYTAAMSSAASCYTSTVGKVPSSVAVTCRPYDDMLHCMFNGINRQCGNDVARVVVTALMINYEQSIGAIFGCSFGSPNITCNQRNILNCSVVLPADAINNMTTLTRVCSSQLDAVGKCLNTVNCVKDRDDDFINLQSSIGKLNMFQYMCNADSKSILAQNFNCIETAARASLNSCQNSSFPSGILSLSTPTDVCNNYTAMLRCSYLAVTRACNSEAARVYVNATVIGYQPSLGSAYNCALDAAAITKQEQTTSPSSGSVSFISMALFVVTAAAAASIIW